MSRVTSEATTTITMTVTSNEAARIMADFDQRREPSIPGKALYAALAQARGKDPIAEAFARTTPAETTEAGQ